MSTSPSLIPPGWHPPTRSELAMAAFRKRAEAANQAGFAAAFPNFFEATYGRDHVGGTIFIHPGVAEWRDVPLDQLDNVDLDDFAGRMRATNAYAARHGFIGGFPNYFHADYGAGTVCGTILIRAGAAEWRDIPLSELGHPGLDDFEQRFRATQTYAGNNGFVGGFPTLFHASNQWTSLDGRPVTVCGTILIRPAGGTWRDVLLWREPYIG